MFVGHTRMTVNPSLVDWSLVDWCLVDWLTGDWLTGDWMNGDKLPSDWMTGDWLTGDWLTGDWLTGDWLTGDWWLVTGGLSARSDSKSARLPPWWVLPRAVKLWGAVLPSTVPLSDMSDWDFLDFFDFFCFLFCVITDFLVAWRRFFLLGSKLFLSRNYKYNAERYVCKNYKLDKINVYPI